jgi:ribosomal protein L40E
LKIRVKYLNDHKICQVCSAKNSTEIHHTAGRRGEALTEVSNFLAVCRECHVKIEMNREWAYEKGYLKLRSKTN